MPEIYSEDNMSVDIKEDVWIGSDAILLRGVCVVKESVVAAGFVVTNNMEAFSIAAGVLAKKIKMGFSENEIKSI